MTKRARTTIFLLLGFIFVLATPALILYSQGYRLDLKEWRVSQVGAFYFNVTPTRAEILVNGQSLGRTSPLIGTLLTKNFPANSYQVKIQKESFHSWEKQLSISSKQVTEAKYITLIPKDPEFEVAKERVMNFWFAPNNVEVLLQKSAPDKSSAFWTLVLWHTQEDVEYPLYRSSSRQDDIENLQWTLDSNSFSFSVSMQGRTMNFFQELDRSLPAFRQTERDALEAAEQLRTEYRNESFMVPSASRSPNNEEEIVKELAETFQEAVLSPDRKKIALSTGNEIWLHFLQADPNQPAREKDERVFLTRFSEPIKDLQWFNSYYLLFAKGNAVMVSEIDTRDRLNLVELKSFESPRLFWQNQTSTLFVHSNSQMWITAEFLP